MANWGYPYNKFFDTIRPSSRIDTEIYRIVTKFNNCLGFLRALALDWRCPTWVLPLFKRVSRRSLDVQPGGRVTLSGLGLQGTMTTMAKGLSRCSSSTHRA